MTADAAMSGPVRRAPIPVQPIYDLTLGSPYRSAWRLAAFTVLVAAVSIVGGIALGLKIRRLLNIIPMAYHRLCCWLLDINIEVRGTMSTVRPTLFGYLAKLQRTVFVDRQRRSTTHHQRDQLAQRLDEGDSLILFPEGTSNDGNRTLPFRSALFGVAERKGQDGRPEPLPLTIQPVSLAYVRLN